MNPLDKEAKTFIKFFTVGATSTLVDWAIYAGMIFLNINYLIAVTTSFSCGAIVNFILNRKYTFNKTNKTWARFALFIWIACISWSISFLLLRAFVDGGINKLIARVLVTGAVFIFNFVVHKSFTFSDKFR